MIITNTEILELLKIILPAGAIIISIISLTISNRNTRRQIRIGRIEEIIEYLRMYIPNYHILYIAYQHQVRYKNVLENSESGQIEHHKNNYLEAVRVFKENNNVEALREKSSRLIMIANSYLPDKEIKKRVISIAGLINTLLQSTLYDHYDYTKKVYAEYPEPLVFFNYMIDLQNELIKEMKLGYKGLKFEDTLAYDKKFLKDLKINTK